MMTSLPIRPKNENKTHASVLVRPSPAWINASDKKQSDVHLELIWRHNNSLPYSWFFCSGALRFLNSVDILSCPLSRLPQNDCVRGLPVAHLGDVGF